MFTVKSVDNEEVIWEWFLKNDSTVPVYFLKMMHYLRMSLNHFSQVHSMNRQMCIVFETTQHVFLRDAKRIEKAKSLKHLEMIAE